MCRGVLPGLNPLILAFFPTVRYAVSSSFFTSSQGISKEIFFLMGLTSSTLMAAPVPLVTLELLFLKNKEWCERGESNPYPQCGLDPKSSASSSSATLASLKNDSFIYSLPFRLSTPLNIKKAVNRCCRLTARVREMKTRCQDIRFRTPLRPRRAGGAFFHGRGERI